MTEEEYKKKLKNKLIEYRKCLYIPEYITFGLEFEYENIEVCEVTKNLELLKEKNKSISKWKNVDEISIMSYYYNKIINGEVVTDVLTDNIQTWNDIKLVLDMLKKLGGYSTEKCGTHINIGTQILGKNQTYWKNFLLLWKLYNDEIYSFCSGENKKVRENYYIKSINNKLTIEDILSFELSIDTKERRNPSFLYDKRHDISFKKCTSFNCDLGNVIEIRLPNGTLNYNVVYNYTLFFIKFLLSCKQELDVERIIYKIQNDDHNAIELADFAFDDEIDKNNFLIQTLKINKVYKKKMKPHIFKIDPI